MAAQTEGRVVTSAPTEGERLGVQCCRAALKVTFRWGRVGVLRAAKQSIIGRPATFTRGGFFQMGHEVYARPA